MTRAQREDVRELDFSDADEVPLYPNSCQECDGDLIDGHCEFCNGPLPEEEVRLSYQDRLDMRGDEQYESRKDDAINSNYGAW